VTGYLDMVICGIFSPLLSVSNDQKNQHFDKWVLGDDGLFFAISLIWKNGDMWVYLLFQRTKIAALYRV